MDLMGLAVAAELMARDRAKAAQMKKANKAFDREMRMMDRRMKRNRDRYRIDEMFYDIGFNKIPYRSGRVPNGGVGYEPQRGNALLFTSYREAEEWLKKVGAWKE